MKASMASSLAAGLRCQRADRDNCAELLTSLGYEYSFKKDGLRYWATGSDIAFVASLNA